MRPRTRGTPYSSLHGHDDINSARRAVTVVFLLNGFVLAVWAARVPSVAARLRLHPETLSVALLALAAGAVVAFQFSAALLVVAALCTTAGITARPTRLLHPDSTTQPPT